MGRSRAPCCDKAQRSLWPEDRHPNPRVGVYLQFYPHPSLWSWLPWAKSWFETLMALLGWTYQVLKLSMPCCPQLRCLRDSHLSSNWVEWLFLWYINQPCVDVQGNACTWKRRLGKWILPQLSLSGQDESLCGHDRLHWLHLRWWELRHASHI